MLVSSCVPCQTFFIDRSKFNNKAMTAGWALRNITIGSRYYCAGLEEHVVVGVTNGVTQYVQCENLPLNLSSRAFQSLSTSKGRTLRHLNALLKVGTVQSLEYSMAVGLLCMALMVIIVMFITVFCTKKPKDRERRRQLLRWKLLLVLNVMLCSKFLLFPAVISYDIGRMARNLEGVVIEVGEFIPLCLGAFCCSVVMGLCTLAMFHEGM